MKFLGLQPRVTLDRDAGWRLPVSSLSVPETLRCQVQINTFVPASTGFDMPVIIRKPQPRKTETGEGKVTVIDSKEAARILNVKERWVADRCAPGCPRAKQVPHFRLPGSRLIRFHAETLQAWADAKCPPWDSWEPAAKNLNLNPGMRRQ